MYITRYKTSDKMDDLLLISDGEYLTGLYFEDSFDSRKYTGNYIESDLPIFDETKRWLDIYFSGSSPDFIPKYKIEYKSLFQREVIDIMNRIPYGEVVTYGDIAKEIANIHGIKKMSSQAVGGSVGSNPICIIVPCHRVVGASYKLTGYGGGIRNKKALLEVEGHDLTKYKLPRRRYNE